AVSCVCVRFGADIFRLVPRSESDGLGPRSGAFIFGLENKRNSGRGSRNARDFPSRENVTRAIAVMGEAAQFPAPKPIARTTGARQATSIASSITTNPM